MFPTKPTTPGQFLIAMAVLALVLISLGGYLLYLSFGQGPEKLDQALQARSLAVKFIFAAVVTGTFAWLGRRFLA